MPSARKRRLIVRLWATAWDGIIPSLLSERIDVIAASLSITEARLEVIDFSNKYYHTGAALAVAAGSGIDPTPEGVAGLTIGVQTATIHQAYANTYFGDATLREYQTQDEANQDLFAGRIDATLADVLVVDEFLNRGRMVLAASRPASSPMTKPSWAAGSGFGDPPG